MPIVTGFFGFGKDATGATAGTAATVVTTEQELRDALITASTASSTLIRIDPHKDGGQYTFNDEVLSVTGRKITIRQQPGQRIVLNNVQFHLKLENIDQILIQGLHFHSNREKGNARDAIVLAPTDGVTSLPVERGQKRKDARVRITHCAFNGYFDIAIDIKGALTLPRLLATIDHCLFFDSTPGMPTTLVDGAPQFVNRGAINIGSLTGTSGKPQVASDSHVTIAYNVYVNVWRRCPRIANGNFAHIFNNLVFRWGAGNTTNNTWRGIEIGGGDGTEDNANNGRALIEANRFIPLTGKTELARTIEINATTSVDIGTTKVADGTTSGRPNLFDGIDGTRRTVSFPIPTGGFRNLSVTPFTETGIARPPADDPTGLDWHELVRESGPRGGRNPRNPDVLSRGIVDGVIQGT